MLTKIIQPAYFSLLSALLWLPCAVSAMVFNPDSSIDIELSGEEIRLDFDSYTIPEGVKVNYFTPKNSRLTIHVNENVLINGELSLPNNSGISIYAGGSFTLNGSIHAKGIFANTSELMVFAQSKLDSFDDHALDLKSFDGVIELSTPIIQFQDSPIIPIDYYYSGSSTIVSTAPAPLVTTPIPAPVFLFSSGLVLLTLIRKKLQD